jgi:hypothetical protein
MHSVLRVQIQCNYAMQGRKRPEDYRRGGGGKCHGLAVHLGVAASVHLAMQCFSHQADVVLAQGLHTAVRAISP